MTTRLHLSPSLKSIAIVESVLRYITLAANGDVISTPNDSQLILKRPNLPDHVFVGNEDISAFAIESGVDLLQKTPSEKTESFDILSHIRGYHYLTEALTKELIKGKFTTSADIVSRLVSATQKSKVVFNSSFNPEEVLSTVIKGSAQLQRVLSAFSGGGARVDKDQNSQRAALAAQKIMTHLFGLGYAVRDEVKATPAALQWNDKLLDELSVIKSASSSARSFAHRVQGYFSRNGMSMLSNAFASRYPESNVMASDVIEPYCQRILMAVFNNNLSISDLANFISISPSEPGYKPMSVDDEITQNLALRQAQSRTRTLLYADHFLKNNNEKQSQIVKYFDELHSALRNNVDELVSMDHIRNVVFSKNQIQRLSTQPEESLQPVPQQLDWMISTQHSLSDLINNQISKESPELTKSLQGILHSIRQPLNERLDFQKSYHVFLVRYHDVMVELYQRVKSTMSSYYSEYQNQIAQLSPENPHVESLNQYISEFKSAAIAISKLQDTAVMQPRLDDLATQIKFIPTLHSLIAEIPGRINALDSTLEVAKQWVAPEPAPSIDVPPEQPNDNQSPVNEAPVVAASEEQPFAINGWAGKKDGFLVNQDPINGGTIDVSTGLNPEWFVIFNNSDIEPIRGLATQEQALIAFQNALTAYQNQQKVIEPATDNDVSLEVSEAQSNQPAPVTDEPNETPVEDLNQSAATPLPDSEVAKMTLIEYQQASLERHPYKDDVREEPDLLAEFNNECRRAWVDALKQHALSERLPTIVIDAYVSEFGVQSLVGVFRGMYEKGVENYTPEDSRIYSKTYRQALDAHKKAAGETPTGLGTGDFRSYYLGEVKKALEMGEPVPEHVRAEYLKLSSKPASSKTPENNSLKTISDVNEPKLKVESPETEEVSGKKQNKQKKPSLDDPIPQEVINIPERKPGVAAPVVSEAITIPKVAITPVAHVFEGITEEQFNQVLVGNKSDAHDQELLANAYALFEQATIGMLDGIDVKENYQSQYDIVSELFDKLFEQPEQAYASTEIGARLDAFRVSCIHLLQHPRNAQVINSVVSLIGRSSEHLDSLRDAAISVGVKHNLSPAQSLSLVLLTPYRDLFVGELMSMNPDAVNQVMTLSPAKLQESIESAIPNMVKSLSLTDLHEIQRSLRVIRDVASDNNTLSRGFLVMKEMMIKDPEASSKQKFSDLLELKSVLKDPSLYSMLIELANQHQSLDAGNDIMCSLYGISPMKTKADNIKPRISQYIVPDDEAVSPSKPRV